MAEAPATLDNVKRVDSISSEAFIRNHLKTHTPVVICDTQQDTRISSLVTEQEFVDAFGDVAIQVQQNYTSPLSKNAAAARRQGLSQKVRNQIREMSLRDYLNHVREDPGTDMLCVEYRTPQSVFDAMKVPEVCAVPWSVEPIVTFMFVANQGNYAHMHFDGDFRNVLLYQIFGRKRVVMVPLSAQEKISPSMNFSKVLVQNLPEEEKLHLFRYLGAYDTILHPGEAILFPPSIWHYVEYVDTGMSVNFRFGRDEFATKMVDANRVPFYPELHQLLAQLTRVDDRAARTELEKSIWTEVSGALRKDYSTSQDRHVAIQRLYRDLLSRVPGDNLLPAQVSSECSIAEAMAVERYDSESKQWREELMLGMPL
ncbi:MAG: cupin-like domain-containing protein [Sciscionella sp.]